MQSANHLILRRFCCFFLHSGATPNVTECHKSLPKFVFCSVDIPWYFHEQNDFAVLHANVLLSNEAKRIMDFLRHFFCSLSFHWLRYFICEHIVELLSSSISHVLVDFHISCFQFHFSLSITCLLSAVRYRWLTKQAFIVSPVIECIFTETIANCIHLRRGC